DADGEPQGRAGAPDLLRFGVHDHGVAPAGRGGPLERARLDHRLAAAGGERVPRQPHRRPPDGGGLVRPGQVVRVEDDALLVALDVPDGRAPRDGHDRHGSYRLPMDDVLAGYRAPSQLVQDKEIDHVDVHCRRFIELSPFATLATADADGWPDVSPRGGDPGFVKVLDPHRLVLPDRQGNNRVDSLRNLA